MRYTEGISESQFLASDLLQDAVIRRLTIIGEAVKRLSQDVRNEHPEVPWQHVAGFRDIAVHDYARVDSVRVWRIVRDDLPDLIRLVEPLVPPTEP
jgi:uncharacterized protein with HEPN domain